MAVAGLKSSIARAVAICLLVVGHAVPGHAHEVRPAIADIELSNDGVKLQIRLSLEALVAGLDLAGVSNTDDSPKSADYDALRALGPAELEAALRSAWPRLRERFHLNAGSRPLALELRAVKVPEIGNLSLPRDSTIVLQAPLAPGGVAVTFGWDAANGPLILRQQGGGENNFTGYLTGGKTSPPMSRAGAEMQGSWAVFIRYGVIGFEHIVPKGLDHILFVLGLFFYALKVRPLLVQVTAFTLAHTITLALAVLGVVSVPATFVEPLIAASIVYVGVENLFETRLGLRRAAVVFGFGLLHGLGFASVLGEIGLDPKLFALGLVGFNLGVEAGQLAVIAAAFVLLGLPFGKRPWYGKWVAKPASVAIALVGAFWFVQRVVA